MGVLNDAAGRIRDFLRPFRDLVRRKRPVGAPGEIVTLRSRKTISVTLRDERWETRIDGRLLMLYSDSVDSIWARSLDAINTVDCDSRLWCL